MAEFDDCKSKISIWWDIENCAVPKAVDAHLIAQNLSLALRHADFNGPIEINAFGDTKILEHNTQKALSDTGITLNHVPRGNKDAADKAILVAMLLWALDNPPPAHLLLISGDGDFANALHRLSLKRYSILLACPPQFIKPALKGAAKKVWKWRELAIGELSEPELSKTSEVSGEALLQNGGPSNPSISKWKGSKKVGTLMVKNSVIDNSTPNVSGGFGSQHIVTDLQHKKAGTSGSSALPERRQIAVSGSQFDNIHSQSKEDKDSIKRKSSVSNSFASPQKCLDLQRKNSCNSAVSSLSESSDDTLLGSQFENLFVQSEEGREPIKRDNNAAVHTNSSDSRSQSLSFRSKGHAPNAEVMQSLSLSSYGPHRNRNNSHAPNAEVTQSAINSSGPFQSNFPVNGDWNIPRQHTCTNVSACNTLGFSSPAAVSNSLPGRVMPESPVKYALSNINGTRPPFSSVAHPRVDSMENRTLASLSPSMQWHAGGDLQKVHSNEQPITKIYRALKTLEQDMLAPTEDSISHCIQFWDHQFENLDLKQTILKAVEHKGLLVRSMGCLIMYFPPENLNPWHCVDPGNMQLQYAPEIWSELNQFLLHGERLLTFLISRNQYVAAQILKKSGAVHIGKLAIGQIILLLQQAIRQKKWLTPSRTGWSPLSVEERLLLDYRLIKT